MKTNCYYCHVITTGDNPYNVHIFIYTKITLNLQIDLQNLIPANNLKFDFYNKINFTFITDEISRQSTNFHKYQLFLEMSLEVQIRISLDNLKLIFETFCIRLLKRICILKKCLLGYLILYIHVCVLQYIETT